MDLVIPWEVRQALKNFFDALQPPAFNRLLYQIMLAFEEEDYYRAGDPADVIFLIDKIQGLLLPLQRWVKQETIFLQNTSLHLENNRFYPGCLTAEEKINPYLRIHRFFAQTAQERWPMVLDLIQYYSLSSQSGRDSGENINSLQFYHEMAGLVLACKLLHEQVQLENQSNKP